MHQKSKERCRYKVIHESLMLCTFSVMVEAVMFMTFGSLEVSTLAGSSGWGMVNRSGTTTVDGKAIYFSVSHLLVSRLSKTKSEVNSQRNTRLLTEHPTPPSKYSNINLLIPITMVTLSKCMLSKIYPPKDFPTPSIHDIYHPTLAFSTCHRT